MTQFQGEIDTELASIASSSKIVIDKIFWTDKEKHTRLIHHLIGDGQHLETELKKKVERHLQLIMDFYEEYAHIQNISIGPLVENPYSFNPDAAVTPIVDGAWAEREERQRFVRISLTNWKNFLEDLYQLAPFGKIVARYLELTLDLYGLAMREKVKDDAQKGLIPGSKAKDLLTENQGNRFEGINPPLPEPKIVVD